MHSTHRIGLPTNQAVALFSDSALTFNLSNGATFADLADRLDHLGERHVGTPTAIYLTLGSSPRVGMAQRPIPALRPGI